MEGLKFDMRIYVLVLGVAPLRALVYRDGLTRLATVPYQKACSSNLEDLCMHLTNYAVNKHNACFVPNQTAALDSVGHKRSLKYTLRYLRQTCSQPVWQQVKLLITKTLIAAQPALSHHYQRGQTSDAQNALCFEVLGFDVMLDQHAKPYLLEVNHSPSFQTDSPLDQTIKSDVVKQAIILLALSNQRKNKLKE